jgi:signal transduction histidine kinase
MQKRVAVQRRLLIIASGLLFCFLAVSFFLFFRQWSRHNRLLLEFRITQNASITLERILQGEDVELDRVDPNIRGFGVYDVNGNSMLIEGQMPSTISLSSLYAPQQFTRVGNDTIRLIRILGGLRMQSPPPGGMGRGRMMDPRPEIMPHMRPEMRSGIMAGRVLALDYDIREYRSRNVIVISVFIIALASFSGLIVLLFHLLKRIQLYREQEDRQKQLLQLGEAARTLTHEIKNPLGAIQLQTGLLKRKLDGRHSRELEVMNEELNRISHLVDRVRGFFKDSKGNPEPIPLPEFIHEIAARLSIDVTISGIHQQNRPIVWFDREKLRSVLENIIRNGAESMNGEAPVELSVREGKRHIEIEICDRGPGVDQEMKEKVFDPFFTTKTTGTGVGLSLAKRFVEAAGGTIAVENREGGGAKFIIKLRKGRERV